ncbi:MAG TPA: hypothetical protein VFV38_17890, partial [Ktedonobacteraceae bacterium]|nr:hypothetical protein [Ktedonobacteraceae bacterium]
MFDMNGDSTTNVFFAAIQARTHTVFADPDFRAGFSSGLEAFEDKAEECGCTLTFRATCQTIAEELDPKIRANEAYIARNLNGSPVPPAYRSGFIAGWVFTYLVGVVDLDHTYPETQP